MSHKTVTGLVARAVEYKEADLILTVLTAEDGKLTVAARGARRQGSSHAAAAQVLCCSRMVLSEYRERYSLTEAEILETFNSLRGDLLSMSLACYLADLASTLAPEGDAFRLTLTALSKLNKGSRPLSLVKAAFELRLLCDAGLDPALDGHTPPPDSDVLHAMDYIRNAEAERVFSFTLGDTALKRFSSYTERLILEQTERPPASLEFYLGLI